MPCRRRAFRARAAGGTRRLGPDCCDGQYFSLKSCRTNALNVRFLADHVCFALGGRHWRRVIGTSAPDPKRTLHSICNRTTADSGMRPGAVGNSHAQDDFVGTRCVGDHHGHGIEMIE